ncbi:MULTISPECIES: beta-ketoacyl-ACP synthase [Chelatococcus]|uniref:3-oxoacyl-[acyl-carrier-protein] synthase II n=1 Tax=Chelatococcus caeni TaxID=1348468 RepID=A0A840C1U8_9HYPH|nr:MULTISPECIES: beta-ketoacyl-ACP synthase [Chelatococcus]ALA17547.1 3-oxoacyl-ACP synthase [Chelatococcus sp. CO-6]MBB4019170.1 3-oxoacyl-[acyl-carrier-protein] synthase II [Chelatococcus caeni]
MTREVFITGIGIVSNLGEGIEAHLAAVDAGRPGTVEAERFKPHLVHPVVPLEWERQIPKKSDQRQMEAWQKLGVYAAGLALDDAGIKEDKALLGHLHLICAAGGGERDYQVDSQVLTGLPQAADPGAFLNERLMGDLRPTLFLAQLSNLLAGNISIVHGVTGATRTFMGEEQAGVDALRIAQARIAADQGDIFLVGGSYNAERPDVLLVYEMAGLLWKDSFAGVWEREAKGGGFIPGSGAAFLVLEARDHAEARGATPIARLAHVGADQVRRAPGAAGEALDGLFEKAGGFDAASGLVVSGATGVAGITAEEKAVLDRRTDGARRIATGDLFGNMLEPQFPAGVALAAALVKRGDARQAAVTSIGHARGEGLALVERI